MKRLWLEGENFDVSPIMETQTHSQIPDQPLTVACIQFNCEWRISGQPRGGDLEDFYLDVCVEGFEKDPF